MRMFVGFQGTVVIDRERRNKNEQIKKVRGNEKVENERKTDGEKKKYKQENINGLYSIDFVILISIVVIMCN